jgi:hypothetical protein
MARNNRLLHSSTFAPLRETELDNDSDACVDESWRVRIAGQNLDEFSDVLYSEKEFFKLWNEFCHRHVLYADCVVPDKLLLFCRMYAKRLHALHLRSALILHLLTLWQYKIITRAHLVQCMRVYDTRRQR